MKFGDNLSPISGKFCGSELNSREIGESSVTASENPGKRQPPAGKALALRLVESKCADGKMNGPATGRVARFIADHNNFGTLAW
jgi:hypothetical protein